MATRSLTTTRGEVQVPADREWSDGEEMLCTLAGETVRVTKREGCERSDREVTPWVEYWMGGELVHRSVHVQLIASPAAAQAKQGEF